MHCFGDTGTFRVLMMLEIGHSLTISLLVFVQLALADRVWSFAHLALVASAAGRSALTRCVHCFGDTCTFRVLMMLEIGHSLTISLLVFVQLALADRVCSFVRLALVASAAGGQPG